MIIKNGSVLLFDQGGFVTRDIRVEGEKIALVAQEIQPLPGEEVVDAAGCFVTPGLIDAHSHICISEEGMGALGDDCNDYSGPLTPELEVLDGIYPFDRAVADSVRAGVTAACVCPGSDAVVGGVCTAANFMPELITDVYNKFAAGDLQGSLEAQFKLNPVRLAMDPASFPVAAKDMAALRGRDVGAPYRPSLPTPEGPAKEGFRRTMSEAGLI